MSFRLHFWRMIFSAITAIIAFLESEQCLTWQRFEIEALERR